MPVWDAGMRAGSTGRPRSCGSRLGRGTIPPFIELCQSRDEPRPHAGPTHPFRERLDQARHEDAVTVIQTSEKISLH